MVKKRLKHKYVQRYRDTTSDEAQEEEGNKLPKPQILQTPITQEKEFYDIKWAEIDKASKQTIKSRAKIESERVYDEIFLKHDIKLACTTCKQTVIENVVHDEHQCKRNKMLLSLRGTSDCWTEVHNVPKCYKPSNGLCDQRLTCEQKSRCRYPHSSEECTLWKILHENDWSLDALIKDIIITDLKLKYTLGHVSSGVKVLVICKICYKKRSYDRFLKAKKTPKCQNGHPWKGNQTLVLEHTGEQNENKKYIEVTQKQTCLHQDALDETKRDLKSIQLLLLDGYSFDDIATVCHQCKQRKHAGNEKPRIKRKDPKDKKKDGDEREEFDDFFGDIVQEVNVDSSEVEESFKREAIECIGKDRRYYELIPHEQLDDLLAEDPTKYKLCTIKLDGSQKATCTTIVDNLKIDIRGRQNCGPTADGDIVVVETKQEEVLDAEWKMKEGTKEEELQVTRGTVVGIKAQNCNRKNYNFVCTVDEYYSHLMMPICGTIPKINCKNNEIRTQPDEIKNKKVCLYQNNGADFNRIVNVNRKNIHDKLFVVKYERWGITHMYSRGYVVKVIKPGFTLQNGQRILNLMYQMPPEHTNKIDQHLSAKYAGGIPQTMFEGREDFTNLNVFSIDPPACEDIDDALSVKVNQRDESSDEMYEVGIHISDVTAFLTKNDDIDIKAATRKTSFYPQYGQPRHMLPDKLSRNLCSLLENERRLTVSLFVEIDKSGKLSSEPKFCRGVVMNHAQLTYTEAETKLLDDSNSNDDDLVARDIKILHMLAKGLRKQRIGRKCFFKETQISYDRNQEMAEESHLLVEEFMILANSLVATHLVEQLPQRTLVRSQSSPSDDALKSWMQKNNIAIQCGFLFQDREDQISDQLNETNNCLTQTLNILRSSYAILSNPDEQDMRKLENVIRMEKMHPTLATGFSGWLDIQTRAKVHLHTDDVTCYHFSLRKEYYTWFTSPIRRYMDIIIHRLLIYVMDKNQLKTMPYDNEEIELFSREFNGAAQRAKQHSKASTILQLATNLQKFPVIVPAFVSAFDDDSVSFELPYLPQMKKRNKAVNYGLFNVSGKPDIKDNCCNLKWQRRLYDTRDNGEYARLQSAVSSGIPTKLNHETHTRKVRKENWLEVQDLLIHQDLSEVPAAIARMIDASIQYNYQEGLFDDVTSEMRYPEPIIKHHATFSMMFCPGYAFPVQLGTTAERGMLTTSMNLIGLSKTVYICTEHSSDPVKCFADIATTPSKQMYRDVNEYKNIWLPILEMESATNAVSEGDPITVHNVPVQIEKANDGYIGTVKLREDFCNHRHINFISDKKETVEDSQDYFCMRFPYRETESHLPKMSEPFLYKHFTTDNVWTAHAQTIQACLKKEDDVEFYQVKFTVNQHNAPPSKHIRFGEYQNCTVEYISKTLPDRRMKNAVENLDEATNLIKDLILGKPLGKADLAVTDPVPEVWDIHVKNAAHTLPKNNPTQTQAIKHALGHKFTMIQGPPGTGKTLTGVKLVYWFNQMNKVTPAGCSRRQVMYCGPSNSAVDVATKQLMNRLAEKCPKIVRVYSEMLENQVFPIPRDYVVSNVRGRKYQLIPKKDQEGIALHYLIRKSTNSYASKLIAFDKMFASKPAYKITDKTILAYQKMVTDASIEELKKYEVILCTCSVSASPRIKRGTNIHQLIIDESGMCMEPEVIVPLVATSPEQIVLIGDHKQLRPIVKNQTAKDLGLEKSLFERYAVIYKPIMLDEQYRMHQEICAFPSRHFYDNKLQTVRTGYWDSQPMSIWPNSKIPVVFCHIKGEEKSLAVATEDGNEQSKSNEAECFHVRRIFMDLINRLHVPYQQISVLSQYKAQCKTIEKTLKDFGYDKAQVGTVVASQGAEWDYVILSTVRSMPQYEIEKRPSTGWLKRNLGFIIDQNQINVAITRARRGLIIIGNKHVLACDNDPETGFWGKLLKFYNKRGCIVDAELFPRRPDDRYRHEAYYTNLNWGQELPPRLQKDAQRKY